MPRTRRGLLAFALALTAALPACGGSGDSPTTPAPPAPQTICFYDGSLTSYKASSNPDIQRRRVPLTEITVSYLSSGGTRTEASPDAEGCVGGISDDESAEITISGGGMMEYAFTLRLLPERMSAGSGKYVMFGVPADLENMIQYIDEKGSFRGWAPGSEIRYRTVEPQDVGKLEPVAQRFFSQLRPIDLDPYNDDGTIIKANKNATEGNGVVRMTRGPPANALRGPIINGGLLQYGVNPSFDSFEPILMHELAGSLGQNGDGPMGTVFGEGGALNLNDLEIRSLRLGTNMAGIPLPR